MHTTVCEIASQQEPTEYPSELGSVPYDGQTVYSGNQHNIVKWLYSN